MRLFINDRRIDAQVLPRRSDADLMAEYAQRAGMTIEETVQHGLRIVQCRCAMRGCPGWSVAWPNDPSSDA